MFAHTVSLQLKPNSVTAFTQTIENDIIPLLRKQPGFQDEIAFVVPDGTEAVSVSVWDHKEHAEAYHRGTYPRVLKALANVVEGTPQVHTYEVSNSTFHKIVARVAG
jgi:heme-degrading monooxygenase HmoA